MSDTLLDLTGAHLSTAREKVLEHRLASELAVLMLQRGVSLDILRSEYDAQGYDVVLEAGGVIRHVQLKASRDGGKRRHVDINVKLRAKPAGCVVWMSYDTASLEITALRWFGGQPGEPLPDLGSTVTRHSKGDSAGTKNVAGTKELLTFLASPESQQKYIEASGSSNLPTSPEVDTSKFSPLVQKGIKLLQDTKEITQFFNRDSSDSLQTTADAALNKFIDEPKNVSSILKDWQTAATKVFNS